MAGLVRLTLVRSLIGSREDQRRAARSLGLTRPGKTVVHEDTAQVRGIIQKIRHLLKVEHNAQEAT
jgi:large subunit ribosomal protein L30